MPQAKLDHCDTDLACIRKDLTNFNQINKDFLGVVRSKMAHFDDTINEANDKLDAKIKEHWSSSQHVFTNFSNTNLRIFCAKYCVILFFYFIKSSKLKETQFLKNKESVFFFSREIRVKKFVCSYSKNS